MGGWVREGLTPEGVSYRRRITGAMGDAGKLLKEADADAVWDMGQIDEG